MNYILAHGAHPCTCGSPKPETASLFQPLVTVLRLDGSKALVEWTHRGQAIQTWRDTSDLVAL